MLDFVRIACAVPPVKVGDVKKNTTGICAYIEKADLQKADIVLFPELALTGYSCGDLFFQDALHNAVKEGLKRIAECSKEHPEITAVVGLPVRVGPQMYNCAAVIKAGGVEGLVPKTYIPNDNGEDRWFSRGNQKQTEWISKKDLGLAEEGGIPVDCKFIFTFDNITQIGVEICEDLMVPMSPSTTLALNGAEIILNLSASHELIGKRAYRRERTELFWQKTINPSPQTI